MLQFICLELQVYPNFQSKPVKTVEGPKTQADHTIKSLPTETKIKFK